MTRPIDEFLSPTNPAAYSPLGTWLRGREVLPPFLDLKNLSPSFEFGGFLGIEKSIVAFQSFRAQPQCLLLSWQRTHKYLSDALTLLGEEIPPNLDKEESFWILNRLGFPPPACLPIYFFTSKDSTTEEIVYLGQTSSKTGRFKNGHLACTKLLSPEFNEKEKLLYFCSVTLLTEDKKYLPLEWVSSSDDAKEILNSIEAQLICHFKPKLNVRFPEWVNVRFPISFHIQNFSKCPQFLNDEIIFPQNK